MLIHAHIYFAADEHEKAQSFAEKVASQFKQRVQLFPLQHHPVGPHPRPMFKAAFHKKDFQEISTWIHLHRGDFSVLLHPVLGNEYKALTLDAVWLGEKLSLNLENL